MISLTNVFYIDIFIFIWNIENKLLELKIPILMTDGLFNNKSITSMYVD